MERGSYIAASGGLLQLRKLELVNNNLANVNTAGYKKQVLVSQEQTFEDTLASAVVKNDPFAKPDHQRTPGTMNVQTLTDFTPGPVKDTGNPLDVALRNPNDFFAINTPEGIQYTRAGNFTLNEGGEVVTQDGMQLQGDGGPITVSGASVTITPNGQVRSGNQDFGTIQVVRIQDPEKLERVGSTRFKLPTGAPATEQVDPDLIPAALEMANVSAISSVTDLITSNRAFDLYTKSALTIDQLNQVAINQIGRPRG